MRLLLAPLSSNRLRGRAGPPDSRSSGIGPTRKRCRVATLTADPGRLRGRENRIVGRTRRP